MDVGKEKRRKKRLGFCWPCVFFIWEGTTGPAVGGGESRVSSQNSHVTPPGRRAHTHTHTHARAQKRGGKKKGGEGSGDKISPGRPVRRIRGGGSARAQLELVQARTRQGGWERRRKQKGRARTRTRGEGRECFENWRRTQHPRRARKRRGKGPGRPHARPLPRLPSAWVGRAHAASTNTHTHTHSKKRDLGSQNGWVDKKNGGAGRGCGVRTAPKIPRHMPGEPI